MSGSTLHGRLPYGGDWSDGSVFGYLVPPQLSLVLARTNLSLAWPTNFTGYVLRSATTLANGGDS